LGESVRWINIVVGPRRVGKTTLVQTILQEFPADRRWYVSADQGIPQAAVESLVEIPNANLFSTLAKKADATWLVNCWEDARRRALRVEGRFVFAIDEVQKIPDWSGTIKGLWDADRQAGLDMHVILLGSSPLLVQSGLKESLMGRFESIRLGHWSYLEMSQAFGLGLEEYIYFGGYPEPAKTALIREESRWRQHVISSLIEPSIDHDVFSLHRIDRPALLKQVFWLSCDYSSQILALDGMAQNLRERNEASEAHTGTIAKYLDLLGQAGLVTGLQKYSGSMLRQRISSPKLLALNTALMAVATGYDFSSAQADRTLWGRMVESVVGAHLHATSDVGDLTYWRKGNREVDFVLSRGRLITAIEVKSGRTSSRAGLPGMESFAADYPRCRRILVGEGGVSLVEFLSYPAEHWLQPE